MPSVSEFWSVSTHVLHYEKLLPLESLDDVDDNDLDQLVM